MLLQVHNFRVARYPPAIRGKLYAAQQKPMRTAEPCRGCGPNRKHDARGSSFKLIEFVVGTKLFHGEKSRQTSGDFIREEYLRKNGAIAFSRMLKRRQMRLR